MDREQKAATIEEIAAQIEGAAAIFAVDYRGISVPQAAQLRGKLREADANFRIVKNRLTKLAAERAGEDRLGELLEGPTALAFVRGDTALAAKAIATFNKEHEILTFKGGFMDEVSLDEDRFKSIARLPSRDVLNGQFAGVVASPLTGLVRGLGSMIQGLALQLGQIAEKGLVSGESEEEPKTEQDSPDPPAAEAELSTPAESDGEDAGPADAPVEEPPTESGAATETPAEDDPSQAEGDAEPAGDEDAGEGTSEADETPEGSDASEGASNSDDSPPSEEET